MTLVAGYKDFMYTVPFYHSLSLASLQFSDNLWQMLLRPLKLIRGMYIKLENNFTFSKTICDY